MPVVPHVDAPELNYGSNSMSSSLSDSPTKSTTPDPDDVHYQGGKCRPTEVSPQVDIEALREKYRCERDKRVRLEGDHQYVEVADDFAEFYETDPYSQPIARESISADIDVAILGAGFAGMLAAARLKEAGVENIRVIDMAGDFGGTWYWNRYPGVQCDIESYCYVPLLEEVGYMTKDRYSYGAEIFEQCQRIGRHFGLYEKALFGTIVRALRWDASLNRWRISTNRGDDIRARFLVMASGPYNRPKLPGIPGLKSFKGHSFHTSRWDYEYTGGDTNGDLHKLADKRVAIVGTGATAVQVVPFLGKYAKHLYVFQRTPSSIDVRGNKKTDPEWVKTLKPGWQAERQKNFHVATFERLYPGMRDLVCDGWTEINRNIQAKLAATGQELSKDEYVALHERTDYEVMERLRHRIDSSVNDPETAAKLKPFYRFLCKRPCFNDDYIATFNRSNVTLVDVSKTRGVERFTDRGVVADGVEYEVDCVVYASGFEITTQMSRRIGIDSVVGRNGRSLYDHWAHGFRTLHGFMTHGFPNQFFTGFIQGGVSVNVSAMYDQQARHIAYIIKQALHRGAETVEPTQEAQDGWVRTMRETQVSTEAFLRECTPGYYNSEGGKVIRSHLGEVYGPGFYAFVDLMDAWRKKGDLAGLVLK
jgi:cyclohexanone monooxygenase